MNTLKSSSSAFSIIEVMIWIFVFALWLTSIFMMLSGSITMSDYSRNLIIASNLANEELELFKNVRDSNYMKVKVWSQMRPNLPYDANNLFEIDKYYKLENNYSVGAGFPIKVDEIRPFEEWVDALLPGMDDYRLCLDDKKRYTYDCSGTNTETNFYRYLKVSQAIYDDSWAWKEIPDAFTITARVIWTQGWYYSTEISTVITDWKKL